MTKILIFIDESWGELDWIVPFILSDEAKKYNFMIFSKTNMLNEKMIENYKLKHSNINIINSEELFSPYHYFIYRTLPRFVQKRLKNITLIDKFVEFIQNKSYDNITKSIEIYDDFDFIFRDFNLKSSFELEALLSINQKAKVVVFPHAVGIQKTTKGFKDNFEKVDRVDVWLENTSLSTRAIQYYKEEFLASGAPMLSKLYESMPLFNFDIKRVFIITRDGFSDFGCTREAALKRYEEILSFCSKNNFQVYVKHHPRDKKIYRYRDIQKKFDNIIEYEKSLITLNMELTICLSFYSTAGIFFSARKIPVFDITPYDSCESKSLPFHYCDDNDGKYTHDLIALNIQEKVPSYDLLNDSQYLQMLSIKQFESLQHNFPKNANQIIALKLEEVKNNG